MQKREVTKKQLAVIILLSIGMLAAAALLNQFFPAGSKQTKETLKQTAVTPKVTALPSLSPTQKPTPTPDPTKKVATFFQGPKAYEGRREWSGKWGKEFYDGGSIGFFGCVLCFFFFIYNYCYVCVSWYWLGFFLFPYLRTPISYVVVPGYRLV